MKTLQTGAVGMAEREISSAFTETRVSGRYDFGEFEVRGIKVRCGDMNSSERAVNRITPQGGT